MNETLHEALGSLLLNVWCCLSPVAFITLYVLVLVSWKDRWRWLASLSLLPPIAAFVIVVVRIAVDMLSDPSSDSHTLLPIEIAVRTVMWSPLSLVILLLVYLVRRRVQLPDRRRCMGKCPKCGFDLRGDLESGCPECGWNRAH